MDKIAALEQILAMDPKNSLARYGIAMEWVALGKTAEAVSAFDQLLTLDPNYTAGYFMAAQTLVNLNRKPEAVARLTEGISSATRSGNAHAVNEMQALLDDLNR